MANETLTPEQVKALTDAAAQSGEAYGDLLNKIKKAASDTNTSITGVFTNLNKSVQSGESTFAVALNKMGKSVIGFAASAITSFGGIEKYISDYVAGMGKSDVATQSAKNGLLLFSAAALNAKASFTTGTEGAITLTSQIHELEQSLGAGGERATFASNALKTMATSLGIKAPADQLIGVLKNMAIHADNATRMQAGIVAFSGATGDLGKMYEKTGAGLQNMNSVLARHRTSMSDTIKSTGQSAENVKEWYMQLGHVPGALISVVKGSESAGGSMNMLTAVTKMAAGNGRDTKAVIDDLGVAFKNFGMTGEPALAFINSFSELSNSLGVEFSEMKAGLMGTADAFKNLFTAGQNEMKGTEAQKNMMNQYVFSLKEAGMTGTHAVETVKSMAGAMGSLTMAQKMFISSQTGGPGGMTGALQIEKMVRDRDVGGLQKKLLETIKKQTGPIMRFEDAEKGGEAGAQKFNLQRQQIMEGPLGGALGVKTSEDASRMLDALYAIEHGIKEPPPVAKGTDGLKAAIDIGNSIQKQSNTPLSEINANVDSIMGYTENMLKELQERALGVNSQSGQVMSDSQTRRENKQRESTIAGGRDTENLRHSMTNKGLKVEDQRDLAIANTVKNSKDMIGNLTKEAADAVSQFMEVLKTGSVKEINDSAAAVQRDADAQKKSGKMSSKTAQDVSQFTEKARAASVAARSPQPLGDKKLGFGPNMPLATGQSRPLKPDGTPMTEAEAAAASRKGMDIGDLSKIYGAKEPQKVSAGAKLAAAHHAPVSPGKAPGGAGTAAMPTMPSTTVQSTDNGDATGNDVKVTVVITPKDPRTSALNQTH